MASAYRGQTANLERGLHCKNQPVINPMSSLSLSHAPPRLHTVHSGIRKFHTQRVGMAEHKLGSAGSFQSQVDWFSFPDSSWDRISKLEIGSETESDSETERSYEQQWRNSTLGKSQEERKSRQVCLEGVVDGSDDDDLPRTKSLTDEDLHELKGCVDLGFGFSYDEIPELCNTLPALELCYSMSQKFIDDTNCKPACSSSDSASSAGSESSSPLVSNWKISSPGDHPEDVKARLKFWAQAVACTVRLCS